jgi:hypothetical protein
MRSSPESSPESSPDGRAADRAVDAVNGVTGAWGALRSGPGGGA